MPTTRSSGRALAFLFIISAPGIVLAQGQVRSAEQSADSRAAVQTIQALFAAAERGDLLGLDSLYAGDSLLVIEGAGINRGWRDYRDNHLGPELKEFKNFQYRPFEIEARVVGEIAWVTYRYAIAADMADRKIDAIGRGTAILEKRGAKWVVRLTQTASRARRATDPPMPTPNAGL